MRPVRASSFLGALLLASAAAAQRAPALQMPGDDGGVGRASLSAVATNVLADMDPARSLGTIVTPAGAVQLIDGGTRAGSNLFHSFARFDLAQGDTARFVYSAGDPAAIANVVSRVTGGAPSHIEGTIDSTALPNADFWFINPAGIMFGAGASLNVPAAAHFSTAQELRFADNLTFAVTTPGGSTFSVASPVAFGFLGGQGAIALADAGRDYLPNGGRLSLAASDVNVRDSDVAGSGFRLAAVGNGQAEVPVAGPLPGTGEGRILVDSSTLRLIAAAGGAPGIDMRGGSVGIFNSDLGTAFSFGPDEGVGGPISISGDDIHIFSSLVSASTFGAERAGDISITGKTVTIDGLSVVNTETRFGSTGAAGRLDIVGDLVRIADRSFVSSSTQTEQPAGNLTIRADRIEIDNATVSSVALTQATGPGGTILLQGGELALSDAGTITSSTDGAGEAGTVVIDMSRHVLLSRGRIVSDTSGEVGGAGGRIFIKTPDLRLLDQSNIDTATLGSGDAGLISIDADTLFAEAGSTIQSESGRLASGNAGQIAIGGRLLTLTTGASITSDTSGSGNAGSIAIDVDEVELRDGARISSASLASCLGDTCGPAGSAGNIDIRADALRLSGSTEIAAATEISSDSFGDGNAGSIRIDVGALEMSGPAIISSTTFGAGRGGSLSVDADSILMRDSRLSTSTLGTGAGGTIGIRAGSLLLDRDSRIESTSQAPIGGDGGSISILAGETIMRDESRISTSSFGSGHAGSIDIGGDRLKLSEFALIASDSQGSGDGGAIHLSVGDIVIENGSFVVAEAIGSCGGEGCPRAGDAGSVTIEATSLRLSGGPGGRSLISSSTSTEGQAGDVRVTADRLIVEDGSQILSETVASGDAGRVDLDVGSLEMSGGSRIATSSSQVCVDAPCARAGNAGAVAIAARGLVSLREGSEISSSTGADGDAGQVAIAADTVLLDASRVSSGSATGSTGRSGTVSIEAGEVALANGASIETISRNLNPAGDIAIAADRLRIEGPGTNVSSANESGEGGDAGRVSIEAAAINVANGGEISTSSAAGAAGDIVITMPRDGLLRLDGAVAPGVITTSSGPGTGGRIIIAAPRAIISNGGSILALGESGGANVQIQSLFFISSADRPNLVAVDGSFLLEAQVGDVSSGTVDRDLSVIDPSAVLRGQCAAVRETGRVSQLIVRPVGPYARPALPDPLRPDGCV